MSIEVEPNDWTTLDPWWSAYAEPHSIARLSDSTQVLNRDIWTDAWQEVDLWWKSYTDSSYSVQDSASNTALLREQLADSPSSTASGM